MLLDADPSPLGTLRCHVARANEQWRDLETHPEAMVIFLGPEAYVSPSAYATKRETGKVVPTWNYVAVHAYGVAEGAVDWVHDGPHAAGLSPEVVARVEALKRQIVEGTLHVAAD